MNTYLYAIKTAFVFFPVLAILVTLPYILSQYRKYGSILILRSAIIYSFILYLLVIYFLVILPLPPISEVQNYTTPFTQLKPFYSVMYLKEHIYFSITNFDTYWNLFGNSYFYQVVYNIFITIPFGVYLRYYFKCSFSKTVFLSFCLSLFFELTQLSGLYGIYPRPYRIFDVDDLITNTLGGLLGYLITPILCVILPTRDRLDNVAYLRGLNISPLRKFVGFTVDIIVLNIILFITSIIVKNTPYFSTFYVQNFLIWTLYFVLLPIITKGRTIGRMLVNIKVDSVTGKLRWYQIVIREYLFLFIVVYGLPILYYFYNHCSKHNFKIGFLLLFLLLFFFLFFSILSSLRKNKTTFYERISKTKYKSTIDYIKNESVTEVVNIETKENNLEESDKQNQKEF